VAESYLPVWLLVETMTQRRRLAAVAVAALLVVAGCSTPALEPPTASAPDGGEAVAAPNADFDDPDSDVLGWEDGYWYNESVSVDQSDGLSDEELRAYVARAMARVEYIRGKEFRRRVPVEIISRAEYRNRSGGSGGSGGQSDYQRWNDQVWEALFVTGESQDSGSTISDTRSAAVAGFYSSRDDEIKVITDAPESPTIDNATLVHELVHGLQDQHYDLTRSKYGGDTQDEQLAVDGLVEGDANYVERRYAQRCGAAWDCVSTPEAGGGGGGGGDGSNLGVLLTIFQPYSDGPVYIGDLVDLGGWNAVDEAFEDPPESTEQVIHRTDERPVPIEYRDRARNGWETFPEQGEDGSDTVGEASMYVMFWYQARTAGADTVDVRSIGDTEGPYDTYNYGAEPSAGWGNDRLFPYQKGSGPDAEYGYVWVTEWDTEEDAREFRRAYRAILDAQDAEQRAENVYVIPDGGFEDAFRVTRSGTRVTIVNGPTTDDLDDIRPRRS